MSQYHLAKQQLNYLRQSLADGKKPIGLFLGAGCPQAIKEGSDEKPLIPDIEGLTQRVCKDANSKEECRGHLEGLLSELKEDGYDNPNVEDILSRIRILREAAGTKEARGLTQLQLDNLDQEICEIIVNLMERALPNSSTPYHKVATWVGSTHRDHPVEIFTTNYDLLIEQALEDNKVAYFDGFVGSRRTFFDIHAVEEDRLPTRWARLWKLHGSINWRLDEDNVVSRGERVEKGQRRIIHPSHLKYSESRKMPYFAMIDRLRAFFKRPSPVMVTCGYSYRDQHINEVIVEGLQGNANAIVFGLLFGELTNYPEAEKLALKRANLTIVSEEAAIIGTVRAEWMRMQEAEDTASCGIALMDEPEVEKDKADENNGLRNTIFSLGDFNLFGEFLGEMIWNKGT